MGIHKSALTIEEKREKAGRPRRESLHNQEKRKRGRPRKDELVVKPIVVHESDRITPKNKIKYDRETVRRAEAIYKSYKEARPNPLNVDEKNLSKEAVTAWKYLFYERELIGPIKTTSDGYGRRIIKTGDELLFLFESFCSYIRKKNFIKTFKINGESRSMPIVPNQTNFAAWLGVPRKTITRVIEREPEASGPYKSMLSDVLSEGAMIGAYQQSSAIFTLKNMCDWADKYEDRVVHKDDNFSVDEAHRLMESLGYKRESNPKLLDDKEK